MKTVTATVPPIDNLESTNFIGKFTNNGSFEWNTFYGINQSEIAGVCSCNNALYITGHVQSLPNNSQYPTNNTYFGTPNAYQPTASNVIFDSFIAKFDENGTRVWGSYYGGEKEELVLGNNLISDNEHNLFHVMRTGFENMASPQAFQEDKTYHLTPLLTKFEDGNAVADPTRT